MKIGVFDSGVGGLTVLAELRRRVSGAEFVYLGDTANLPYGSKSPGHIEKLATDCALKLKAMAIDALVVACNSVSSLAMNSIREAMGSIPSLGVVDPGVQAVLSALEGADPAAPVLILATRATVNSHAYGRKLGPKLPGRRVIEQACPLLVPMIEEGWVDHPILHETLREYLAPHLGTPGMGGVALLGCTHYPWIQSAVEKALPGWKVINSAQAVVDAFELDPKINKISRIPLENGKVEWIFTDPAAIPEFAKLLVAGKPDV